MTCVIHTRNQETTIFVKPGLPEQNPKEFYESQAKNVEREFAKHIPYGTYMRIAQLMMKSMVKDRKEMNQIFPDDETDSNEKDIIMDKALDIINEYIDRFV